MRLYLLNLIRVAFFCIPALFLMELLMLQVPNRYSFKRSYIENHLDELEILLLGNCHIEDALIPNLLGEHVFNAAISGREPVYDFELGKKYIPLIQKLKVVVMPLDYRSFAFGRQKSNPRDHKVHGGYESTFKCMNYKYLGIHIDEFWYWSEFLNSELNYKQRIWMSYAQQIETDTTGFVKLLDSNKLKDWEFWDLPRIYDISVQRNSQQYEELLNGYLDLARISHEMGVKLILLSTPMYKTYQEDMVLQVEEEMKQFVGIIQSKYPDVDYYDFQHDERFLPEDFHDASHLSESGSVKFSKIFASDILHHNLD